MLVESSSADWRRATIVGEQAFGGDCTYIPVVLLLSDLSSAVPLEPLRTLLVSEKSLLTIAAHFFANDDSSKDHRECCPVNKEDQPSKNLPFLTDQYFTHTGSDGVQVSSFLRLRRVGVTQGALLVQ